MAKEGSLLIFKALGKQRRDSPNLALCLAMLLRLKRSLLACVQPWAVPSFREGKAVWSRAALANWESKIEGGAKLSRVSVGKSGFWSGHAPASSPHHRE